jgi:hypothetical protein
MSVLVIFAVLGAVDAAEVDVGSDVFSALEPESEHPAATVATARITRASNPARSTGTRARAWFRRDEDTEGSPIMSPPTFCAAGESDR